MKRILFSFLLVLHIPILLSAQYYPDRSSGDTVHYPYWAEMMQDPGANFYATRHAFEKYWEGRTDHKGNGWKVFKRWEYIMQDQLGPDGKLPAYGSILADFEKWKSDHSFFSTGGNWTQVGPVALPGNATGQPNGMGRVNAIGFHPTDPNTLYIGSPSGGLWKSADGGSTWSVLTTNLPTLGVSSVLVHPTTSTTIWIGTGDRDAGDAPGLGVYKSTDGGSTWLVSNTGMGNVAVGKMLMLPSDPNTLLAAASSGIFKSTNGGSSWVRKSANTSNYKDIRFKPGDPTIVYATEGGRFYRSTNTGDSWTQVTTGVLSGTRLVIGVSAAQPTWVYLIQTNGPFTGCVKSTDNGQTFTTQSTTPNIMDYSCDGSGTSSQSWYDLCIAVDPANANTLYVGGINIWKSINGGTSWTITSHWVGSSWGVGCAPSVHADVHVTEWSPLNSNLYTGCDGGFYTTTNGGTAWTDLSSGLAIAQVYKIGQSATNPGLAMNGYQDNGTSSNSGSNFTTVIGGDGMECIVDYSDTNYRYGELYYGEICRTPGGYGTIAANGVNGITEGGAWVTPYLLHRTIPSTMFIGYNNVWRSTNCKASSTSAVTWTKISSGETLSCNVLEQSAADVNVLYVSRGTVLKRTDNANDASPTWTTCTSPSTSNITDIKTHPADANTVYATAGPRIYKSTNKGSTWTDISGTLPASTINCLAYDKNSNEGIYVGNKTGVFYKDATMADWISFNNSLPNVDVRELEIYYNASNPFANLLKAATYGRGQWQSDLYGIIPTLAVTPPNQNVPATPAGSTSFTVTSNSNWTVASDQLWCTVTPSGSGNGTITANYLENPTVAQRIASLTVTVAGISPVTVTVTQDAALPYLTVQPLNRNVPATPPDTTSFTVGSNTNWTASSDQSWCSVTPSGTGSGTIVAHYDENLTIYTRIASITVTVSGVPPVVVTVTQSGVPLTLSVSPPNRNVPELPGQTEFYITSNAAWTAGSNMTWCNVTPQSGTGNDTIVATYLQNLAYAPRVADITVTVAGLPQSVVTVTQDASTVGIGETNAGKIAVFPNPSSGKFRITASPGITGTLLITIRDLQGEKKLETTCEGKTGCSIDASMLPAGCYLLSMQTNDSYTVRKVTILK